MANLSNLFLTFLNLAIVPINLRKYCVSFRQQENGGLVYSKIKCEFSLQTSLEKAVLTSIHNVYFTQMNKYHETKQISGNSHFFSRKNRRILYMCVHVM